MPSDQSDIINELKTALKNLEERIVHLESEFKQKKVSETKKPEDKTIKANGDVATKQDITTQELKIQKNIIETTDSNFNEKVLNNSKPVLIDFWAEWCGPCKQIAPILEEISNEMKDQVVVVKHNIDENPNQPSKYGVRGIPTMLLFKDGELRATKVGATTKSNIVSWIKENI